MEATRRTFLGSDSSALVCVCALVGVGLCNCRQKCEAHEN